MYQMSSSQVTPTLEGVTLVEHHVYASKTIQDDPIKYSVENGLLVQVRSFWYVLCVESSMSEGNAKKIHEKAT